MQYLYAVQHAVLIFKMFSLHVHSIFVDFFLCKCEYLFCPRFSFFLYAMNIPGQGVPHSRHKSAGLEYSSPVIIMTRDSENG